MKNLTKILCLMAVVIAMACSKEGPAGTAGKDGKDGNANVMYSDWFSSNWVAGSGGSETYKFDTAIAHITQDVLDKGVILAYTKLTSDGTNVRPLPATTSNGSTTVLWNYVLTVGHIKFTTNFSMKPRNENQFRYIIIPASTHLRLAKPLKDMTYNEVCELYNIPK